MAWKSKLIAELGARAPGGYLPAGPLATEPTALAAIALAAAAGKIDTAARSADWLQDQQSRDGSIGVMTGQLAPQWPTSLAMLAWQMVDRAQYADAIARAASWTLDARGTTTDRKEQIGHDTALIGWPWAAGTHSWLEPTAFFVLALRAIGQGEHPRTREGVRLLVDRILPHGGCNYGNTIVLGQPLLPHVQSTGIALWALGGEQIDDRRIGLSLDYLEQNLSDRTATASLCYALMGLAAHGRRPADADRWLEATFEREYKRGPTCYKLALLALAATLRVARPFDEP
jgi:hypothetical protein